MVTLPIKVSGGNDLCAEFRHKCFKNIRFSGYNDANFFDNVNKEPREYTCPQCGETFKYRWTRRGVEVDTVRYDDLTSDEQVEILLAGIRSKEEQ